MQNQRSLLAQFLRFSSATVASLMVFSLYSIVDGLFVAKGVGDYAMAAVNLAVPFTNVMFSIAVTFAVGTSTILSIYLGQGNREHANRLFSQNLVLLAIIGLTITALVLVFLEPFALLLGAEEETLGYTMSYLRGLAPFAICFIVSYNLEILVKTDGRPMLAILTVCIGCLTNCVLDYVAIFVLNWGAWGAAFATGLSQLLTCVIYITHFFGNHTTFHLVRLRPEGSIYRRLIPIGYELGLVSKEQYEKTLAKYQAADREVRRLEHTGVAPSPALDALLERHGETEVKNGARLADLIRRPRLSYAALAPFDPDRPALDPAVAREAEITIKYAGYIDRQLRQVEEMRRLEDRVLPRDMDYLSIHGLRMEARQKLQDIRPRNLGQASRVSGVSPADVAVLMIYLKQAENATH